LATNPRQGRVKEDQGGKKGTGDAEIPINMVEKKSPGIPQRENESNRRKEEKKRGKCKTPRSIRQGRERRKIFARIVLQLAEDEPPSIVQPQRLGGVLNTPKKKKKRAKE